MRVQKLRIYAMLMRLNELHYEYETIIIPHRVENNNLLKANIQMQSNIINRLYDEPKSYPYDKYGKPFVHKSKYHN